MDRYLHAGLAFDVRSAGPEEGEPVVLLHGWPQDRTAWNRVTPALAEAGLRTFAPDLRGYSPGARPRGRAAYRMGELVGDVTALLDAAGLESAHVVGHDWGGALAWGLADRVPARVRTLTVLSTPHPAAMAWAFRHGDQARRSWYMLAFQVPLLPEVALRPRVEGLLTRAGLPPEDAARYAARFRQPGAAAGGLNWYRGMAASRGMTRALRPRGPGTPGRVEVPATYVWGARDPVLGRAAAERTGRYVGADYRFVELDAGHWLPETRPGEVAREVLSRVRG